MINPIVQPIIRAMMACIIEESGPIVVTSPKAPKDVMAYVLTQLIPAYNPPKKQPTTFSSLLNIDIHNNPDDIDSILYSFFHLL